ncbi:MAG: peptidoglycan DD-metalloendopeptidase family protein [Armatimonadetes bacterium]|nr:peptidoglycan DD-metalloendopeptidase family protein [Armatimonadota bacterium]
MKYGNTEIGSCAGAGGHARGRHRALSLSPCFHISIFLCLAVGAAILLLPAAPASGAKGKPAAKPAGTSKRAAQKKLNRIQHQIRQKREVLRRTKRQQRKVSEEIRANEEGLREARARLSHIHSRLAVAERDLSDSRRRLAGAQARLSRHIHLLRGRMVDIYKQGSVSTFTVLLQARDMWDLTSRGYLLQRVVRHDVDLLDAIKREKREIALQTARLRSRRNQVADLRAAATAQVEVVGDRLEERQAIREELSRDRARLEAALAELEENSREVEQMLRAFEARPDVARRIPRPWSGGFARPVDGPITSRFGMRLHPVLGVRKLHTGVDFGAPAGTPIRTGGDGVVVHAGWWGGYGNCIVIAHGAGRSTLYGHCSSVAVSAGQTVRRGQVIGRVGSTGFSTGSHLHFEVRRSGVPVNPLGR